MPLDMTTLDQTVRRRVDDLLSLCAARGVTMRPYTALRDPYAQARLWRQSRSREEIAAAVQRLTAHGAPFLAECLWVVGPQYGDPVTNALPGLSWHQWGEAVDCFWLVAGQAEWSTRRLVQGINGYQVYAQAAGTVGLTAGGLWPRFKDWPHVQGRPAASPQDLYSLGEISRRMEQWFGDLRERNRG